MSQLDKTRHRFCLACLLLFFFVSLTLPSYAWEKDNINIVVVLSKNTLPYQQFNNQLQQTLRSAQPRKIKFHVIYFDIVKSILELYDSGIDPDFIVAAGTHASQKLITADISAPIIFSLIPGSSYQNKIQNSPYCKIRRHCSAVYLEQPVDRQFAIIKKGLPDLKRLGIILGSTSIKMRASILRAGEKYSIDVRIEQAEKDDNLIVLANKLGKISEALLAIPDPDIYNRKTAKGLLLSSYKNHIPFIAYSHGFVRAGALFSIYSTPEQIARQTGMMLIRTISFPGKKFPAPEYPDSYKVEINPAVLRSLRSRIHFNDSILHSP